MSRPREVSNLSVGVFSIVCMFLMLTAAIASDKKIPPDQLVARHLDAIGSAKARETAATCAINAAVEVASRTAGGGYNEGQGLMVSDGAKFRLVMKFPTLFDSTEDVAFDGKKTATGIRQTGGRNALSQFLELQNIPLKEGLIGGVMSTAWPFRRFAEAEPKLNIQGTKKIAGHEAYKVRYRPKKGTGELTITLYFDQETFRHVRSEYQMEIGGRIGINPGDSYVNTETNYLLTEEFSDFKEVDGLTIPQTYKIQLTVRGVQRSSIIDWTLKTERLVHNAEMTEEHFKVR